MTLIWILLALLCAGVSVPLDLLMDYFHGFYR